MASSSSRKRKTLASKLFVDPPSASFSEEESDEDSDEQGQEKKEKTANLKSSLEKPTKNNPPLKPLSHNSPETSLSKRHAKSNKSKTEAAGGNQIGSATGEKKLPANRLWSQEHEIHILKGAIEFQSKFGKDVSTNYQDFHDFVKGSLHLTVTKTQLADKFRKLKKKYNNVDVASFSNAHELNCFNLCENIGRSSPEIEKLEVVASIETCNDQDKELLKEISAYHMSDSLAAEFLKNGLSLLGSSELKELNNKWKNLSVAEMELYLEKIDILCEETRMVLNAIKSNKD